MDQIRPEVVFFGGAVISLVSMVTGNIVQYFMSRGRLKHERQLKIFDILMATRAQGLSPFHVEALNSVPVAFYGHRDVTDRWYDYFKHLHAGHLSYEVWGVEQKKLMTALLLAMAKVLKYNFSTADIDAIYYPEGYRAIEQDQQIVLFGLARALSGGSLKVQLDEVKNEEPPTPRIEGQ